MSAPGGGPLLATKSPQSNLNSSNSQSRPLNLSHHSLELRRAHQRRSDSAASASRQSLATPRNSQSSKKNHRRSGKPRIADEDAFAESDAIMRAVNNRRGESITHLMQFSLPPRPQYDPRRSHFSRFPPQQRRTWGVGSGHHAVDKTRYVNANYRFVVDPRRIYEAQVEDPDAAVDWDSVMQILVSEKTQRSDCPICLDHPVAARMARCGHVFCLPCLSRYMHSSSDGEPRLERVERRSRCKPCPICHDLVHMHEARPVKWFVGQENESPIEGQDIVLRLMVSSPGRTLAIPRECAGDLMRLNDVPDRSDAEVMDYARIMKGSKSYMHGEYDRELEEIRLQEKRDTLMFEEDPQWTQRAEKSVREAQQRLEQLDSHEPVPSRRNGLKRDDSIANSMMKMRLDNQAGPAGENHEEYRYFYQGLLHNYLASLDVRILRAAFGHWSSFPSTILPRVLHVSTGHVVDEPLKKRSKYLAHLPTGCEVTFLECDWTDIVSTEILEQFKPELEKRQKQNQEKELREERERVQAEKEEDDKKWAAARRRRADPSRELAIISNVKNYSSATNSVPSFGISPPHMSPIRASQGSAFAPLASPSSSPPTSRTVWGTAAIAPTSPIVSAVEPELEPDGWLQWEVELQGDKPNAQVQAPAGGGKKKGKKQKVLLMSTNGRRGN